LSSEFTIRSAKVANAPGRAHSEASISLHLAERAIRGRAFSLGDYGHPGYGVVSVAADGSGFKLKINKIAESVAHLHSTFSRFRMLPSIHLPS
jgi:hypothetical protein